MSLLDRLTSALEAGTPGPWYANVNDLIGGKLVAAVYKPASAIDPRTEPVVADMLNSDEDADLIVAAVNALPALLRVARAAQEYGEYAHNWRCEYRTAAKGWQSGMEPIIECSCGLDELDAALEALGGDNHE